MRLREGIPNKSLIIYSRNFLSLSRSVYSQKIMNLGPSVIIISLVEDLRLMLMRKLDVIQNNQHDFQGLHKLKGKIARYFFAITFKQSTLKFNQNS